MSKEKLIKRTHTSHLTPRTSQKGITLIALVVTIIVVLIVTGVTMGAVLGDEGLIVKARQRAAEQTKKSDEEAIDIAITGQEMDILQSGIDTSLLEEELREKYDNVSAVPNGDQIIITLYNEGEKPRSYPINKKSGERVDYSTPVPTSDATTAPTQTIAPTVTPSPTPTPTPTSNTVTVTYKLGIETVHTEEVEVGSEVGWVDYNEYMKWAFTSWGYYLWGATFGWSIVPNESYVEQNRTYIANEDMVLYGCPNRVCSLTISDSVYIGLISMEAMQNAGYVTASSSSCDLRNKCFMY